MKETVEQYIQRIRATLGGKDPVTVLTATTGTMTSLLEGQSKEALSERPAPEKWSVAEILAHLAEAELVIGYRVRMVLSASGTPIQAFDQDVWAERYANFPVATALEMFRAIRAANLELYRALSADEWEKFGMHSERGKETVRRIAEMQAGHDINHLQQIEAILGRAEHAKAS